MNCPLVGASSTGSATCNITKIVGAVAGKLTDPENSSCSSKYIEPIFGIFGRVSLLILGFLHLRKPRLGIKDASGNYNLAPNPIIA